MVGDHEKAGTQLVNEQRLNFAKDNNEIHPLLNENGFIDDFDRFETYLTEILKGMELNPSDNPLILSEPSNHNKAHRMRLVKSLFETLNVPCVFLVKSGVLSAFSCGKSTCLVLDSGHNSTWSVPVHEGYVLQKSTKKDPFAGAALNRALQTTIESKGF